MCENSLPKRYINNHSRPLELFPSSCFSSLPFPSLQVIGPLCRRYNHKQAILYCPDKEASEELSVGAESNESVRFLKISSL